MGAQRPLDLPQVVNQHWSVDFVSDQMTNGCRFRILTALDNSSRECRPPLGRRHRRRLTLHRTRQA